MTLQNAVKTERHERDLLPKLPDLLGDLRWETVPIQDLVLSGSPRARGEDPVHTRLLAETDSSTEPLLVHRSTMQVIDGVHRLRAAQLKGLTEVRVQFFDGSEADAFVLSVQLNIRHGLPLTLGERKAAAQRIIGSHPHWSDRVIAERTGLSAKTVGKVRRRVCGEAPHLGSRLGLDGRARPVSSVEGRHRAAALLAANPEISLRELSRKTGLSVGTVRDVRHRVDRGGNPIPERLRCRADEVDNVASARVPAQTRGQERGKDGRPLLRAATAQDAVSAAAPGSAPAAIPAQRAGAPRPAIVETAPLVRKLTRDPSLRATETGRMLLRMLLATELEGARWEEIAEVIPDHCVPLVRAVVLKRSEEWQKMASMVQLKSVQVI